MPRIGSTALLIAASVLSSCASPEKILSITGVVKPYRSAQVRLTLADQPISAAHVRAVPIDASAMALPATPEVIEQAMYAWGDGTSTDDEGHATLKLFAHTPHLIEVSPAPFGDLADEGPWTWIIEADAATIVTNDPDEASMRRPRLQLVEP